MKHLLKKAFLLLALVGGVNSAWASTVEDLKTIATDYVFIADDVTSNGTAQLTANTLYDGNIIFAPTANTVSTKKGSVTFEGDSHLNSLRIKNAQDRLSFKVNGACTVTFYTQSHDSRGLYVSKSDNVTSDAKAYAKQTASTPSWEVSLDEAGVYYLTSYGGDFYIAGFQVTYSKTGQPTISANPVSAEYSQGDAATALSVTATAANEGALSYQWYKNETNQSVLAGEGATEIDGATNATYTPSTAAAGTTYYFCKVTEAGNANVATTRMAKVLVNPAGFDVTYSLGEVTGTVGTLPEGASHVTSVTIPVNKTLYKNGYTLTAWNDGSADHAIKSTFDVVSDVTLTPVFTENGASSYLGHNASTVTWGFQTSKGDPAWNLEGFGVETKGYYIAQTSVGGSNVDLLMTMDATNGKINNESNDNWAQMNNNTILTVPVIVGAEVDVKVYSEGSTPPSFGGNAGTYDSNIYSYTATANGDLDITIGDQGYVQYVTITYPSESALLTVSAANTQVGLTKTSIEAVDYLNAVTDAWQTNKTYGGYTGDFVNMSKAARYITIKVTGASTFETFVQNSSNGRTYTVKVGDGEAQDVTHGGTGVESSGIFAIADPSAETTIKLAGGGTSAGSVYPVYIVFNPAVSVEVSAAGMATYVNSDYNLDFSETTLKAYTVEVASKGVATLHAINKVPAGTPVLLIGATENVPVAASTDVVPTNNLLAGTGAGVATTDGEYTNMILNNVDSKVGFYFAAGQTVAANRAYLHFASTNAPAAEAGARGMILEFADDILTGINEAAAATEAAQKEGKFVVDGKLVIFKKGMKFNANGARIY